MTAGDATGWGQHRMEAPDYMLDAVLQASLRESLETSLAPASAESPLETDAEAEAEEGAGARAGVESEAEAWAAEEGRSLSTTPTSRASPEPAAVMPAGSMSSVTEDTPPPPPPPHTSVTDVTASVAVSDSTVGPALSAAVPPEAPAAPVEQHEWRVCGEGI